MELTSNCNNKEKASYATNFWNKFYTDLSNPRYIFALYKYLKERDLTNFDYRKEPKTMAKTIMKEKNIKKIFLYMQFLIHNNKLDQFYYNEKRKLHLFKWKVFFNNYLEWLEENDYPTYYRIRECDVKAELLRTNSFRPPKSIKIGGVVNKYCILDMIKMKEFIDNYLKNEDYDEEIEDMDN